MGAGKKSEGRHYENGREVDPSLIDSSGRRKVGEASPEVRKRALQEALKSKPEPRSAQKAEPEKAEPKKSDAIASGLNKLLRPKSNIEKALSDLGE